jgi:hypothetical protein
MLYNIKALSLSDKKLLLAMLQADLGLKVEKIVEPPKPHEWVIETRKCNMIVEYKRAGKSVMHMRELDSELR